MLMCHAQRHRYMPLHACGLVALPPADSTVHNVLELDLPEAQIHLNNLYDTLQVFQLITREVWL